MTDLREQLADVIEVAIDNAHDMDVTHRDYANASADAIIAALPGMVQPLVWVGNKAIAPATGIIYIADWYDAGDLCTVLTIDGDYQCGEMNMDDLKAAAQAHYAATIMQAFGVQGGEA